MSSIFSIVGWDNELGFVSMDTIINNIFLIVLLVSVYGCGESEVAGSSTETTNTGVHTAVIDTVGVEGDVSGMVYTVLSRGYVGRAADDEYGAGYVLEDFEIAVSVNSMDSSVVFLRNDVLGVMYFVGSGGAGFIDSVQLGELGGFSIPVNSVVKDRAVTRLVLLGVPVSNVVESGRSIVTFDKLPAGKYWITAICEPACGEQSRRLLVVESGKYSVVAEEYVIQ